MPNVLEITKQYLVANGYDGLYNPGECCCEVSDLAPCGEIGGECRAGYKVPCPGPAGCPADGDCEWHVAEKK